MNGAFYYAMILSLAPTSVSEARPIEFVVWNVGQGSWSTLITERMCIHFDVGGEKVPTEVRGRCRNKRNQINLTHWDKDHIQFLPWLKQNVTGLCTRSLPPGSPAKSLIPIAHQTWSMKPCRPLEAVEIFPSPRIFELLETSEMETSKTANGGSQVFELEKTALIPGDSGHREERFWSRRVMSCPTTLVLGHHGSKNSTSEILLTRLKCLRLAIASSRKKRYGHPHPEIAIRLQQRGIPLLTTEVWGHIRLRLPITAYGLKGRYSISRSRASGS